MTDTGKTQLAVLWGGQQEVNELVERFRAGLPGLQDVPAVALAALAQFALAHDLDPWNGEVWLCVRREQGTGRILETWVQGGVKGRRKLARRQLGQHVYYVDFKRVPRDEYKARGFDDNVILVEECHLRRSDVTERYIQQLDQLYRITGDYSEAVRLLGDPPVFVGQGVVRSNERSRMEKSRLARKRAEDEALTIAFDLPFADRRGGAVVGVPEEGYATEGEYTEEPAPLARPYDAQTLRARFREQISTSTNSFARGTDAQYQYLASLMGRAFSSSLTPDPDRYAVLSWLTGREISSSKQLTGAEVGALLDLLADDSRQLRQDADIELHNCLQVAREEWGRLELPGTADVAET